ncbi:MAG TPA: diguanylate cyclase, partial [Ardenticatenaceae bacterium]|nr:diguanylate cyclase [Ardenticatenaceae bacterium]
ADDYITKPFQYPELLARIRAGKRIVDLQKELLETNKRLELLSITDGLTKLHNHRYFQDELARAFEESQRYQRPLSLAMIDIDFFKKFNDTYGHLVGDQVLQVIAESIEGCIRDEDADCRYGGDEFAVLLPNADRSRSLEIAGNIERAVHSSQFSAQELLSANGDTLSVSIGISTYPEIAASRNDLLEQADQAMYQAKSLGGGVAYYVPSARIGSGTKPLRVVK